MMAMLDLVEGDAFVFVDRKTRGTRPILGYPTQKRVGVR
jgi:hypothetical protein